jgi:hypothetical protein
MSYLLVQIDGSGSISQSRNITSYGGGGTSIINHQTTVHNTVGRCVNISGTPAGINDGLHSIVQRISALSTKVTPAIVPAAVSGTCQFLAQGAQKVAPTSLVAATFTAPDTISGLPTDFDAALVQRNDRVLFSGTTSNDGAWFVNVHPTIVGALQVRPLNGGAAIVSEAGAGTIEVRVGTHMAYVVDEASPTFGGLFATGTVDPAFGSGVIGDFRIQETRRVLGSSSTPLDTYALLGIGSFNIFWTVGGTTSWQIREELVYNANALGLEIPICKNSIFGGTGIHTVQLGSDGGGSERTAADEESVVIGVVSDALVFTLGANSTNMIQKCYGSYWRASPNLSANSVLVSSLIHGHLSLPGSIGLTGGSAESIINGALGSEGFFTLGSGLDAANVLIHESGAAGFVAFPATPVVFEGLLKSDLAANPLYRLAGATFTVLDPREDYSSAELFDVFTFFLSASNGYVKYTWNPTFRERDATGALGAPIVGIKVRVFDQSFLGVSEISGSPFTTNANGQLGGGAGLILTRWWAFYFGGQIDLPFTQRIIIEGQNYRAQDVTIQMSQKLVYDHAVDVQQTDFEGELSR